MIPITWSTAGSSALTSFLASIVEFVEALTIVLAVGSIRGWRSALLGAGLGVFFLALLIILFGTALRSIPIAWLQITIGTLLLLFGLRWLRKAILRQAGVIALHDEEKVYSEESRYLKMVTINKNTFLDLIGISISFKAIILEGLEIVFIVVTMGGVVGDLKPAIIGAVIAGMIVMGLGLLIHKPLTRVPENTLKYIVGLLLSSFGIFWLGEGLHCEWPRQDLAIIGLFLILSATSFIGVKLAKNSKSHIQKRITIVSSKTKSSLFTRIIKEIYGLIVDDASLAAFIIIWIIFLGLSFSVIAISPYLKSYLLTCGMVLIILENVSSIRLKRP